MHPREAYESIESFRQAVGGRREIDVGQAPDLPPEPQPVPKDPPPPVLTEPQIVGAILRGHLLTSKGVSMPHYTPKDWWECDVAHFTEAGYLTEYEIKLSRSDFLADLRKERQYICWGGNRHRVTVGGEVERKHDMIAAGAGPKQFYFVCPEDLLQPDELPDYAGLIYVVWRSDYRRWGTHVVKKAQKLKARKFEKAVLEHCRGVAYYRLLHALAGLGTISEVRDG